MVKSTYIGRAADGIELSIRDLAGEPLEGTLVHVIALVLNLANELGQDVFAGARLKLDDVLAGDDIGVETASLDEGSALVNGAAGGRGTQSKGKEGENSGEVHFCWRSPEEEPKI